MKTFVTTFALSLALCAAAGATAQTRSAAPAAAADSVLLSETTDGDYVVRKFVVKSNDDAGYSVRYQINLSRLSSTFDGNPKELGALNSFVENLMKDTLANVKSVDITGYSSPDGPLQFNRTLAANRARDFKNYVDRKYGFSKKYDVKLNSEVDSWDACRAAVAQSSIPEKQAVLNVIDGKQSAEAKEAALKKMPAAVWTYLAKNILPPLRRVELTINYGKGSVVEQRTMIPKPKPAPAPAPETKSTPAAEPCCVVVDESITGIIVEMPESEYGSMPAETRHEVNQVERDVRMEAKAADKLARKEARDAERVARQAAKEARKMEKAEAKAAKKMF